MRWPSAEELIAEVTTYVLHTRDECECPTFGACAEAAGLIVKRWEEYVLATLPKAHEAIW